MVAKMVKINDISATSGEFYVYLYRDARAEKNMVPIYVGKGSGRRALKHWLYGSANQLFQGILDKIRDAGLEPMIEIVARFEDEQLALLYEVDTIAFYGRRSTERGPLANMTDGGDGVSGPTEETRRAYL